MTDRSARTLAPAPAPVVEPRFVIPAFVPSTDRSATASKAVLREAPVLATTVLRDPTPAQPVVTARVEPAKAIAAPVKRTSKPVARAVAKAAPVAKPRTYKARHKAVAPRPSAAPVIVAQAQSFISHRATHEPDYLIGVYR